MAWLRGLSASLLLATAPAMPSAPVLAQDDADLELGKQVFTEIAEPQCGVCHTLAAAGTSGEIGPNLDALQPSEDRVETVVREGVDVMPAFEGVLSDEQIKAVAKYVSTVAGQQ